MSKGVVVSVVFIVLALAAVAQQPSGQTPPPATPAIQKEVRAQGDWGEVRAIMTCSRNLRQLQSAKEKWAAEHSAQKGDAPPAIEELVGADKPLKAIPECPKGGKYNLNPIGEAPTCSVHGTADQAMQKMRERAEEARATAEPERTCMSNLRMIKLEEDRWAGEQNVQKGAKLPALEVLFEKRPMAKDRIKCPSGGQYALGTYGDDPTCTVHKSLTELQNKIMPEMRHSPVEGLGPVSPEQGKMRCMMNLRRLNLAVGQWAKEHSLKPGDAAPTMQEMTGPGKPLSRAPGCPSGGTYKIGKIGEVPECSIHGKYTEPAAPSISPERKESKEVKPETEKKPEAPTSAPKTQ